jgi:septum site-determining protein MinD
LGELIAVVSGKGGTGKTSFCAGVSIALANAGLRVLCIDCDVGLRNLDISLGMSDTGALSFLDVSEGTYSLAHAPKHPLYPNLSFLTAPMNRPLDLIDIDALTAMLRDARGLFDYIILDSAAGIDTGFQLVATISDRFLLVTGSGPAAIRDATRVGEVLEKMGKTDIRLVVNRVNKSMMTLLKVTIDDVMDTAGLPLLGIVPEDEDVPLAAACQLPLLRYSKRAPATKA